MSRIRRSAGIYAIAVGISIIAWWGLLFTTSQMPEMESEPIAAWLHVTAEAATGFGLLLSGTGLLQNQGWAKDAFMVSSGMLAYAVIQASGYFAQAGQVMMTIMFVVLLLLNLFFLLNSSRLQPVTS